MSTAAWPMAQNEPGVCDWQGQALDCAQCPCHDGGHWNVAVRCELGRACVEDRYARRVERFFNWNPRVADHYLGHPYFEVRAIAARHASVFRLTALIDDTDETVRLSIATRLPQKQLQRLLRDPHREVRIRVAMRLDPPALAAFCDDEDYYVRMIAARRLPVGLLPRLANDPDREVRMQVVARIATPLYYSPIETYIFQFF